MLPLIAPVLYVASCLDFAVLFFGATISGATRDPAAGRPGGSARRVR
jgi:hypothetical protein